MLRPAAYAHIVLLCALVAFPARAFEEGEPPPPPAGQAADPEKAAQKALCDAIETAAQERDLPVGFFTRLLWQESRFRSDAVSPKGAQGIAQFMPGTAADRGLADPFDARAAIPASAHLLFDLKRRFGNLGLAAAAYNAGETRVHNWLSDAGGLPYETRNYVLAITGIPAETWADSDTASERRKSAKEEAGCLELAARLRGPGAALTPEIETVRAPWGVQVAGNFSKARAISAYSALGKRFPKLIGDAAPMIVAGRAPGRGTRAFYQVRLPAQSRAEGEKLCQKLRQAGGSCVVLKT